MTQQTDRLNAALAGRYRIERHLGEGGMASVYLCEDIRHKRKVALKLLKPELAAVLGADRFVQEITTTASLQHPHILPLFDSGTADGFLFYVMPLVEGETLREKLNRETQLGVDEAIRIAREVLDALEYAHQHGIVHRDVKPENILLHGGHAMVADFGIALAVSAAAGGRMTETGLSLGTPHYMSPEQATAEKEITARSDVYSLGSVLYEMLTGNPPHVGSSAQQIIMRIITDAPRPVSDVRKSVPPNVVAAVAKSLEKLPADRFESAKAFADALANPGYTESSRAYTAAHAVSSTRASTFVPWSVAALAVIAAAWTTFARTNAADETPVAFTIDLPTMATSASLSGPASIAVSRDGELLAYVAGSGTDDQIFVRKLSDVTTTGIAGPKDAWTPFFSPDGKYIAVVADHKIMKAPSSGGALTALGGAEAPFASGSSWGRDGSIVTGQQPGAHGLVRFSAESGLRRVLTNSKTDHGMPLVLDDGETVLFMDWGPGFTEDDYIGVASLKTGEFVRTNILAVQPLGVVDGWLIYATVDGRIMAVRFDLKTRKPSGEALQLVTDALGVAGGAALSSAGTLAYVRGTQNQRLVLIDSLGTHAVSDEERLFATPVLSPDGQRVALSISAVHGAETTSDIWTFDRRSKTLSRLTTTGNVVNPRWTADGKRLVFASWFDKSPTIWIQQADGSAPAEKLLEQPDNHSFRGVVPTPDGRGIVYCARTSEVDLMKTSLFYMPLTGERRPETLLAGTANACDVDVSPDGRWLAYGSDESGSWEVSVRPFRAPGERVQVSQGGGAFPVWSRDGKRVVSWHSGKLTAATVAVSGGSLRVERSAPAFASTYVSGGFDLSADGRQLLTLLNSDQGVQLVVVKHWLTTVRARIAAAKR